jgi:hypothetical protein
MGCDLGLDRFQAEPKWEMSDKSVIMASEHLGW